MVFSKVQLVVGVVVDRAFIIKLLKLTPEEAEDEGNCIGFGEIAQKKSRGKMKLKILPYPGCSEIEGEKYIIGKIMKSWVRKNSRCEKCEKYSLCDTCIGQTCYGFYDVMKIVNSIVEVPVEHVCLRCWKDNKKPISVCEDCGTIPNWNHRFDTEQKYELKDTEIVKQLNTYKKTKKIENPIGIYLMLDDCLCCS